MSDLDRFLGAWGAPPATKIATVAADPPTLTTAQILEIAAESKALGEDFDRRTRGMDGRGSNIKHSSESARWFTPAHIVEPARAVLGTIDLDPASEASANAVIQATRYITEAEDGLVAPWGGPGTVWLNPPGGKYGSASGRPGARGAGNRSLAGLFWERLIRERDRGNVTHAVFLAFNLELLQTTQGKSTPGIGRFTVCIPDKRIRFTRHDGHSASPTHGNAIVYVPGTIDAEDTFYEHFRHIGTLMKGI